MREANFPETISPFICDNSTPRRPFHVNFILPKSLQNYTKSARQNDKQSIKSNMCMCLTPFDNIKKTDNLVWLADLKTGPRGVLPSYTKSTR